MTFQIWRMNMTKRYTVRADTGRKKDDGESFYTNIGSAWEIEGGGFSIALGALPLPTYDEKYGLQTRLLMVPADEVSAYSGQAQA